MSERHVAPIKRSFPASTFATPSEAPVGEYFPDEETLRIRQKCRIWARISDHMYFAATREAAQLMKWKKKNL